MKIAVKVTVEMTPKQIEDFCFYTGIDRGEVRENIKDYIRTALQDAPEFTGDQADVSVS